MATSTIGIKPWKDTRAKHKRRGAAELETIKRQALYRAANLSATASRASASPRYTGRICARNPAHGGERYLSGGGCVACARELAERKRRARGVPRKGPAPQSRHPLKSAKRHAARIARMS